MGQIYAQASSVLDAHAELIYAVLVDYKVSHPAILPKKYFKELTVEQGGKGAGTRFRTKVKVMGVEQAYDMKVSEPTPGRVLVETDVNTGLVTTFTVEPMDDSKKARVIIATTMSASPGIKGRLEGWLTPPLLKRIYKMELRQLATYLNQQTIGL